MLSSFSLVTVSLAAGSTTAATDEQEISPVLEIKLIVVKLFKKIHFTSYSFSWYEFTMRLI
jgi:hypothetical protein